MLLIRCPWCGERAQTEFSYGGDATVVRLDPDAVSLQEWLDAVYLRDNPCGPHTEWWHHSAGCRRWLKVHRNTLTYEVLGSGPANATFDTGETE